MANVLSVLREASDDDIRNQVATLDVVTIKNIMGVQTKETMNKAAGMLNSVGRFLGSKGNLVNTNKPKGIDEQIKERIEALAWTSRFELDRMLRNQLIYRLGLREASPSDELISKELVNRAAKHMDVDDILAPAEKIDAVFIRYFERLMKQIREAFEKADIATKEEIRSRIQNSLDTMSDEARDEIRAALKTNEVTADTVISMMRTTGFTGLMASFGSLFGSYVLLSILIHGVFTTLLGITVPFAVYTGAATTLSFVTGPIGWAALAVLGIWQYLRGSSKVDGELYCQLIFTARFIHKRTFAPEENDLPAWILGQNDQEKVALAEAEARYRAKEVELKKAKIAKEVAEQKYNDAVKREEAKEEELNDEKLRVQEAKERIEKYEQERQKYEQDLKFIEKRLLEAVNADKQSSFAINKLKREVRAGKEKIEKLKEEYEHNLEIVRTAPVRELEIDELIKQAMQEAEEEQERADQAEYDYNKFKVARDIERQNRIDRLAEGLQRWFDEEKRGYKCITSDEFLSQMGMSNIEMNKAVLKAIKQILEADTPQDLGEQDGKQWRLPIKGTGKFIIYDVGTEGRIDFLRFTDASTLEELKNEREEKRELERKLFKMKEEHSEKIREIVQKSSNTFICNQEIKQWFDRALVESKKELDILSPWLASNVVNEKFYNKIEILLERGVVVKILYGIKERSKGKSVDEKTKDVAIVMEKRFSKYKNFHLEETNSHGKMLLCDDSFYIITSYNFLSFSGNYKQKHTRGEVGICSENQMDIESIRMEYFMF